VVGPVVVLVLELEQVEPVVFVPELVSLEL
jgi:hypothetical protein